MKWISTLLTTKRTRDNLILLLIACFWTHVRTPHTNTNGNKAWSWRHRRSINRHLRVRFTVTSDWSRPQTHVLSPRSARRDNTPCPPAPTSSNPSRTSNEHKRLTICLPLTTLLFRPSQLTIGPSTHPRSRPNATRPAAITSNMCRNIGMWKRVERMILSTLTGIGHSWRVKRRRGRLLENCNNSWRFISRLLG